MKTKAVKCVLRGADLEIIAQELDTATPQKFENDVGQDVPALFIMTNSDLERIKKFKDLVIDRGRKNPAKELPKLLLQQGKHSGKALLLRTDYTVPARLKRSLKSLLQKAEKAHEKNYYIIGVNDEMVEDLREGVRFPQPALSTGREASEDEFTSFVSPPPEPIAGQLAQKFVGGSAHARRVRTLIYLATQNDSTVLILGETGTGKEVVARAIHEYDQRINKRQFVPVNCSAMPENLFESEVFGHKKGAFTGAIRDRAGLWKNAQYGTLFLDEIGDLSANSQSKVLRALEAKKIRPVGSSKEEDVGTVRVIAATNRDVHSMVQSGRFRDDLYWRLVQFFIRTPSLRDHPEDIPILAQHFWKEIVQGQGWKLAPETLNALGTYSWPGNARQLRLVLMSLHSFFPKEAQIQVKQLRFVLKYLGAAYVEAAPESDEEIGLHNINSLRNLRRVEEVLRMCSVKLRPLIQEDKTDARTVQAAQAWIGFRLKELEELCAQPSLFGKGTIFLAVHQLLGKMKYFNDLLETEPTEAVGFWRREVFKEFQGVCSKLEAEGRRLLSQA